MYAICSKPEPETRPDRYAVIYVGHSDDLSAERFPFQHPRAHCWVRRAGSKWKVYICTYEVPGRGATRSGTASPGRTSGSASTRRRPTPARSPAAVRATKARRRLRAPSPRMLNGGAPDSPPPGGGAVPAANNHVIMTLVFF